MNAKYLAWMFSALCVLGFALQACSDDDNDGEVQVGVCLKNPSNDWRKSLQTHAVNFLKEYGLSYSVGSSVNEEEQGKLISAMVKRGCKVLIVSPEGEPKEALSAAAKAGIPVVLTENALIDNYAVFIEIDNIKVGKSAAGFFNKQPNISKIALFNIDQDKAASAGRINGVKQNLKEGLEYVVINLDKYTPEEGAAAVQKILKDDPEVDAIYAQDDDVALGVLSALGESNQIKAVVGCGGSKEYFTKIKNTGNINLATTLYSPKALMKTAVDEANEILKSSTAPVKKLIGLESELVDKSNVDAHLANPPY